MRSGLTVLTTFICSVLALVTIMTIGSFNLQRDEIERAVSYTLSQTARQCVEDGIEDEDEIASIAEAVFRSQINSKKGTLKLYVLYADKDILDISAVFSYKQYNGSEKQISCRKTYLRDWEEGNESSAITRFISPTYLERDANNGGLKDNSVWKNSNTLSDVLSNQKNDSGEWVTFKKVVIIKSET